MKIVDRILAVLIGTALAILFLCFLAVSCIENNRPVDPDVEQGSSELVSPLHPK